MVGGNPVIRFRAWIRSRLKLRGMAMATVWVRGWGWQWVCGVGVSSGEGEYAYDYRRRVIYAKSTDQRNSSNPAPYSLTTLVSTAVL